MYTHSYSDDRARLAAALLLYDELQRQGRAERDPDAEPQEATARWLERIRVELGVATEVDEMRAAAGPALAEAVARMRRARAKAKGKRKGKAGAK